MNDSCRTCDFIMTQIHTWTYLVIILLYTALCWCKCVLCACDCVIVWLCLTKESIVIESNHGSKRDQKKGQTTQLYMIYACWLSFFSKGTNDSLNVKHWHLETMHRNCTSVSCISCALCLASLLYLPISPFCPLSSSSPSPTSFSTVSMPWIYVLSRIEVYCYVT